MFVFFGGWCSLKWRRPIGAILDEEINSQPRAILHRDILSIMGTKSLQWSGGQAESQRGRLDREKAVVAWLTVGLGRARRGWTRGSRWVPPPVLFLSACFGVLLTFCVFMNLGSDDSTLLRSLCSVKVCVLDICFARCTCPCSTPAVPQGQGEAVIGVRDLHPYPSPGCPLVLPLCGFGQITWPTGFISAEGVGL